MGGWGWVGSVEGFVGVGAAVVQGREEGLSVANVAVVASLNLTI